MFDDRIIDQPFKREDLPSDFEINLFGFRFDDDDLIVKKGKTQNSVSIYGAVFLCSLGFFFAFLTINGWLEEGYHFTMIIYIIFALAPILMAVAIIYNNYFLNKVFEFSPEHLTIINSIGKDKTFPRTTFRSVFIKQTITTDQSGFETNRSFDICLKYDTAFKKKDDYYLFNIEMEKETLFFSNNDPGSISQASIDSIQIGKIISDYWNIPFSKE